jgi:hypothetical protein
MRRQRIRLIVVLLCIAVVLLAAFAAPISPGHDSAILTPIWLLFSAVSCLVVRRPADCGEEQPVPLLSLLRSRAPPARLALV